MKHVPMRNLTPAELARCLWRRPGWFLVPVMLGLAAAIVVLRMTPPVYRSSTLVMVEPQKVPQDYVKPTVTTDIDERLKTLEQQITNRSNIERIIREMKLYPEMRRQVSMDKVVDQMRRRDLTVQRQGDVFRIYFKSRDPEKAAATANRVAELFILENLKLRENQAQGTSSFLKTELEQTRQRLEQQEARIASFKQLHMGELPEQRDTNFGSIGQLQTKLEINMDAIDRAETRKLVLQARIAEMSRPVATAPGLPAAPAGPSRRDTLLTQLAELRSRYTERHPDVIRLKEEIAQVERLESGAADLPAAPPPEPAAPRVDPTLRAELQAIEYEIRSLRAERERILGEIAAVQARLEDIPRVEQELLSLTRDYDNIRRSYESLLDKQTQARLAENLEKRRQSEQFTILEKASPPSEPFAPKKELYLAAGLAAGCLAGLLLALLREQTDSTYVDGESLQQAFPGVPVLATIPIFSADAVASAAASHGRFRRK